MKAIDKNKPLLAEIERIRDDSLDRERLAWDDVIANVHDLQVDRDHWKGDYELSRQICLALAKAITGIDLVTFDLNGVVAQAEGQRRAWANLQSRDSFDGLRAEIDHKDQLIRNLQEEVSRRASSEHSRGFSWSDQFKAKKSNSERVIRSLQDERDSLMRRLDDLLDVALTGGELWDLIGFMGLYDAKTSQAFLEADRAFRIARVKAGLLKEGPKP